VRKSVTILFKKKTDLNIDILSLKKIVGMALDHSVWFMAKTTQKSPKFRIKRYS